MFRNVLVDFEAVKFISGAMPIFFGIAVILFVVLGIVLAYHWRKYSYNSAGAFMFQVFYWVIGVGLLIGMGISLITFTG